MQQVFSNKIAFAERRQLGFLKWLIANSDFRQIVQPKFQVLREFESAKATSAATLDIMLRSKAS